MIAVKNIFKQIRIDLKDINEVQYSDWDLENAMNKAVRLMANHYSMHNTDFLTKSILICDTPTKLHFAPPISEQIAEKLHGDSLPEDFISIVKVIRPDGYELHPSTGHLDERKYLVYRGCIFTLGPVLLFYSYTLPNYSKDDTVDLPVPFFDFIVEATKIVLAENFSALTEFIKDNAEKMIPSRRLTNARVRLPWRV